MQQVAIAQYHIVAHFFLDNLKVGFAVGAWAAMALTRHDDSAKGSHEDDERLDRGHFDSVVGKRFGRGE